MNDYAILDYRKGYIYKYMIIYMRKITVKKDKLYFEDEIIGLYEKVITKFGSGAKIDAPKDYLGKKVIILVCND